MGFLFLMTYKTQYNKFPFTNDDLIVQLENRGLTIENSERAKRYLEFIGYYRLSAYFLPYQNGKDQFKEGAKFDDILSLYIFDRKLKLILMDAIERIEVAIRSAITNYMSLFTNDPHWFLNKNHFDNYSPEKGKSYRQRGNHVDPDFRSGIRGGLISGGHFWWADIGFATARGLRIYRSAAPIGCSNIFLAKSNKSRGNLRTPCGCAVQLWDCAPYYPEVLGHPCRNTRSGP